MIDSDTKSENETQGAEEDIIDVSSVTTECNNLQSISEITKFLVSKINIPGKRFSFYKNPLINDLSASCPGFFA